VQPTTSTARLAKPRSHTTHTQQRDKSAARPSASLAYSAPQARGALHPDREPHGPCRHSHRIPTRPLSCTPSDRRTHHRRRAEPPSRSHPPDGAHADTGIPHVRYGHRDQAAVSTYSRQLISGQLCRDMRSADPGPHARMVQRHSLSSALPINTIRMYWGAIHPPRAVRENDQHGVEIVGWIFAR
jgi:hypothetical protein